MHRQRHLIALLLVAFVTPLLGHDDAAGQVAPAVKAVRSVLDELLEWTINAAPKVMKRGEDAGAALEDLTQTLKRMRAAGEELAPRVAEAIKKNIDELHLAILRDDTFFKLASRNTDLCDDLFKIAKRHPVEGIGQRLGIIVDECNGCSKDLLQAIGGKLSKTDGACLLRGLAPQQLNEKQIQSTMRAIKEATGNKAAGESFELLARKQCTVGNMPSKLGLKEGSTVLDGRHNLIHGIDGIGVTPNGTPVIMEFTIDRGKNLAQTGQLSPNWVCTRWNKLIQDAEEVAALRDLGVRDEFLRPIDEAAVRKFGRKFIALSDDCLTDTNRLAVGLGLDDLLVLGRSN